MNSDSPAAEAIAVIGMAGRFPMASSPAEFWQNLITGRDCVAKFETEKGKIGARGILENPDLFDAEFFGIHPKEAELMDPQHRIFLECAWECLEDAGIDPAASSSMIGVYAGLSLNTYLLNNLATGSELAKNYQVAQYQTMLGNDKDFLPVRVSYKLNLRGPSMSIQSACSTSLVAISQAATALLTYQCDMAIAGGISITFPQQRGYHYEEDGMVSPDGTCRTFDASAKGTVFSHGCGTVLLKRLSEALADGDPIHAVIRGWAVNNDGSDKVGFAAPSVNAQAEAVIMAQAAAGVHPSQVSYVEAHGTGTPLGDPIEIAALTKAFHEGGASDTATCSIGSGKTHIGHLDCAAGVTGLIKTILQFRHEKIPGLLYFEKPNPHIDFASSPFIPVSTTKNWTRGKCPRIAGVSAFGVGGTNAHVIVEEPPHFERAESRDRPHMLALSARTPEALATMAKQLADFLEHENPSLGEVEHTLAHGRRHFAERTAFIVSSTAEAADALRNSLRHTRANPSREVVFLFPGQGCQKPGMASGIYKTQPVFRQHIDLCADLLLPRLGIDIRRVLFPASQPEYDIHRTSLAQPCIFAVEFALAKLWMSLGIRPAMVIGHSIGEFVAAVIAGVYSLENALSLVAQRGALMQALPAGSMLAVRADAHSLDLPEGIELAAINSPALCTLSGPTPAIEEFSRQLSQRQIQAKLLVTSHAFHSAAMEPMMQAFALDAARIPADEPAVPWISTATGDVLHAASFENGLYWARQLRDPVQFSKAVSRAFAKDAIVLLEVGAGQALANFARQNPDRKETPVIASLPTGLSDEKEFLIAAAELWKNGIFSQPPLAAPQPGVRRIHLPTYPFQRKSYWIDRSADAQSPVNPPIPPLRRAPSSPPAMQQEKRAENLASQLRNLILELSGTHVAEDNASFTELGFDSLFLTQASQAVFSRWGVKVTFRQMLGELSSIASLAQHLDKALPAGQSTPVPTTAPATDQPSDLQQLLASNLQLMQSMLGNPSSSPQPASHLAPVRWPENHQQARQTSTRFGPFKPIESGEQGGLTITQKTFLAELIKRYTSKTQNSKSYTITHRPHFADPRAVAGFKILWKELVYPIVSAGSKGSHITDIDGNDYIDITMGFGTYFFGHSPEWLTAALHDQLQSGIEIGPQSAIAGELAKEICELTGMERATFCNTGSEAVMAAIRLARCVTGRDRIVYFTGDYHGMFEEVLVRGSWIDGVYKAQPIAPGIPQSLVENMLVLDYGDPASLEILRAHAGEIAAVLVEPVQSRAPGFQPREFMHALRQLTRASGSALIFDEVVTGFRCSPGGAQEYFGVEADLATYGKVIGGGMPIGVLAGKKSYMDALDGGAWNYGDDSIPEIGVTFFAGTFVRHPLAMAAAKSVIHHLKSEGPKLQIDVEERVSRFCRTLNDWLEKIEIPIRLSHFSAVVSLDYTPGLKHASLLWFLLREKGIHVWEGRPIYFTTAHTDHDFDKIIVAFVESICELQNAGFLPQENAQQIPPPSNFPRFDSAPTTEAQREIFHAAMLGDEANCAFNESNVIRFNGPLNPVALKTALHDIVVRHPALRSTFSPDYTEQYFHPAPETIEWTEHHTSDPSAVAAVKSTETATPFDLVNGPLVRFQLIRSAPELTELVITAHHLVCDGWSFGMILAELATCYNARRDGKLPKLPPAMSFASYARDESRRNHSHENSIAESYWVSQFSDRAPVLALPTDRPRPATRNYRGAMEHITLSPPTYDAIRRASPALGGTLFSTLLASFAAFLHSVTQQEDLVIGVPAAAQTRVGRDELIGHCLNFLPLRLRPQAVMEFANFAAETRDLVMAAYDHQDFTFGSLLQKIDLPRDPSRVPLVSAIFNIDKNGTEKIRFNHLFFDVATNPKQFVNFDLFFNLVQTEAQLIVECEYNTGLHDAATIRNWLAQFEEIIATIARNGTTRLNEFAKSANQSMEQLALWNATDAPLPPNLSLQSFFENRAAEQPDAIAVKAHHRTLTYRQLDRAANALARKLCDNGVSRESLVVVCADRKPETIVAILAVLKAGGAYVPVDPNYPAQRIAHFISDSAAPIVLTRASLAATLPGNEKTQTIFIDDVLDHQADALDSITRPEDLAYVIYTSGSTGVPKGVAIEHRNAIALIAWAQTVWTSEEMANVLFSTSICFDLSIFEMFGTFACGGAVVLAENALAIGDHPHRREITLINTVPSAISELIDANFIPPVTRVINLAGELLPGKLVNRIHEALPGIKLYDLYGPSEDTTYSTFTRRLPDGPATIGKPISNTRAYIVDENGNPVVPGVAGELLIGGAGLARGYLNRPELTAEKFIIHPQFGRVYRTGDRTTFLSDGNIKFLGRFDHQVKIRGFRIELGEIESALESHPDIEKAIVAVKDDKLAAYFTCSTPAAASPADGTAIWKDQWDMLYTSAIAQSGTNALDHLDSVIAGWSGIGNLDRQVEEWIATTVERIQDLEPKRVYEIGCGTGQLLSRIAPDLEWYCASDISRVAIDALHHAHSAPNIYLLHRPADNFTDLDEASLDLVIINSVAQYFPDAAYLSRVLSGAAKLLKPGGRIFLGDVQSNSLLPAHHASALHDHAVQETTCADLRAALSRRLAAETELSIDPEWFDRLAATDSRFSLIETHLRRGQIANETNTFHYDVILHIGDRPATRIVPAATQWANMNLEQLEAILSAAPSARHFAGIPDARLFAPLAFLRNLKSTSDSASPPPPINPPANSLTAEDLHLVAARTGHRAHVRWQGNGSDGKMEAIFLPQSEKLPPEWPQPATTLPTAQLANSPASTAEKTHIPPDLRAYLASRLPDYMVPAGFLALTDFPLTPNGKIDRNALPAPDFQSSREPGTFTPPRNETETKLAGIWRTVLKREAIGIHDDIFALGGDSILIFQISTRANREGIAISPAQIFRLRNIAALAAEATLAPAAPATPVIQRVNRDAYRRTL